MQLWSTLPALAIHPHVSHISLAHPPSILLSVPYFSTASMGAELHGGGASGGGESGKRRRGSADWLLWKSCRVGVAAVLSLVCLLCRATPAEVSTLIPSIALTIACVKQAGKSSERVSE